jgi:hypothetical protein
MAGMFKCVALQNAAKRRLQKSAEAVFTGPGLGV